MFSDAQCWRVEPLFANLFNSPNPLSGLAHCVFRPRPWQSSSLVGCQGRATEEVVELNRYAVGGVLPVVRARAFTLPLAEFVRRFLLHVLPRGFVRIRYYGFLANGARARSVSRCRNALAGVEQAAAERPRSAAHQDEFALHLLPRGLRHCPHCKDGRLRCVQILERPPPVRGYPRVAA